MSELKKALAELVLCKDIKDEWDSIANEEMMKGILLDSKRTRAQMLNAEYQRRQPLAWAAARAALSQPEPEPASQELPDKGYCALQYVEASLAAIANRREIIGDVIQPLTTITAASKRAKAALSRCGYETLGREVAALQAEAERLRVNADRYEWLRDVGDATWRPFGIRENYSTSQADAAVDQARLAQKGD